MRNQFTIDIQMANQDTRRSSSLNIRQIQIKTTMQYAPIRLPKVRKTDHTKHWKGCGETDLNSLNTGGKANWYNHSGKTVWQFLKLNIHSPYDPTIPLLGFYPREKNAYVYTKTRTQMFIAAFF